MELWITWYWSASQLSSAFSRKRTFLWFLVVLAGLSIREDLFGVTSIVRALLLKEKAYDCLLKFFHRYDVLSTGPTNFNGKCIHFCAYPVGALFLSRCYLSLV